MSCEGSGVCFVWVWVVRVWVKDVGRRGKLEYGSSQKYTAKVSSPRDTRLRLIAIYGDWYFGFYASPSRSPASIKHALSLPLDP